MHRYRFLYRGRISANKLYLAMNLRKISIPCTKNSMSNCRHNNFDLPGWLVAIHSLRATIASFRSNQFLSEIPTFFIKCQILQPRNDFRLPQTTQNAFLRYVSTVGASINYGHVQCRELLPIYSSKWFRLW